MDIVLLISGPLPILVGANVLTDDAVSVAKRFNISSLVIRLTIMALGTSVPELTANVASALKGSSDTAIGNVVGSNVFNVLMVVGCTIAIIPISVTKDTLNKEIPLCMLTSTVLSICANNISINGAPQNNISSSDEMLLLRFSTIFLGHTLTIAHSGEGNGENMIKIVPIWKTSLFIVDGLVGLIREGQFFVDGTSGIACGLGVSGSIIGLTLVAGGTSLPELAVSAVAVLKKDPEVTVGNIIGSSLSSTLSVLGCNATIAPMSIQGITNLGLGVMIGLRVLLHTFGLFLEKRTITRPEGILLIVCYIVYIACLIVG